MTQEEYEKMSQAEKKKEDWMNSKWRPMMGWMYMLVCMMDMVVFPILWSLLQTLTHSPITQWNLLTLQGAGLFHIAMGAVLGIAAFGRTQEKLNGANNGGATTPAPASPPPSSFGGSGFGSAPTAPATTGFASSSGFGAGAPAATPSFGAPASVTATTSTTWTSSTGKLGPAPQQDPVL